MDVRQYAKIPVFIEEDHHDVRYFYVELLNEVSFIDRFFRFFLIFFEVWVQNTYLCKEM